MKYIYALLLTIVTFNASSLDLGMPLKFHTEATMHRVIQGDTTFNNDVNSDEVEAFIGLSLQPSKNCRITAGITYLRTETDHFVVEEATEGIAYTLKWESVHTIATF